MKITDIKGPGDSGKPKRSKKTGDKGAFDALLSEAEGAEGAERSGAASETQALEATSSLFALQEVGGEAGSRRQSMQQGRQSLQVLDELRRDLLLGEDNAHTLQRMKDQQKRLNAQPHDPVMKGVIDDIDLRLSVEIAKRESMNA